jgi:2-oxoisovalerate dehydrogenase E1 component beta subunit
VPLDIEAIEQSVRKTGRCMIVHEATRTSGFGAELSALVQERCFYHLEAPIERVTGFDTPYPHSLEWAYFPGPVRIGEAIDRLLKETEAWRVIHSACPTSAKALPRPRSSHGM